VPKTPENNLLDRWTNANNGIGSKRKTKKPVKKTRLWSTSYLRKKIFVMGQGGTGKNVMKITALKNRLSIIY